MNNTDSTAIVYYLVMFIVSILVTWVVLALILQWVRPALYNANGSINWWTVLWVAALLIVFVWLVFLILRFLFAAFSGNCNTGCQKPDPCQKPPKIDPCDPCAKQKLAQWNANNGTNWDLNSLKANNTANVPNMGNVWAF